MQSHRVSHVTAVRRNDPFRYKQAFCGPERRRLFRQGAEVDIVKTVQEFVKK